MLFPCLRLRQVCPQGCNGRVHLILGYLDMKVHLLGRDRFFILRLLQLVGVGTLHLLDLVLQMTIVVLEHRLH